MNRFLRTIAFLVGAVALGIFAIRPAAAGNYVNANVLYYEVTLQLDQYFVDSPASSWVLIDDITYSAHYTPCEPSTACDYFDADDVFDHADNPPMPFTQTINIGGPEGNTAISLTSWNGTYGFLEYVVSKTHFSELTIVDMQANPNPLSQVVDACSWSTYGQLAFREYSANKGFKDFVTKTAVLLADERGNSYAAGAGGEGLAIASAMPMTIAMVPTSQSRHFQTPYIVQYGNVYFKCNTGASGITQASAYVKGRTISRLDPNVPVLDQNIVVETP